MAKLCLNSRDELLVIDLECVAFLQANGNYTELTYISGQKQLVTLGLTKVEEAIRQALPAAKPTDFVRLGRSLIINQCYLNAISVVRQKLILTDYRGKSYALTVPKPLLKAYKEQMKNRYVTSKE